MRSIQWKLVLVYLLLILLAMELGGFYVLRSLEQYYLANFSNTLYSHGQLTAAFMARYLDKPDQATIRNLVADFGRQIQADVTVLNSSGEVIASSHPSRYQAGARLARDEVTQAVAGSKGESSGRDSVSGERRYYLAVPVRSGGRVTGILDLAASLEPIYRTLGDIRLILLTALAIALVATAVVGYALASTITRPIQEITSRAAEMAAGNFEQKIRVHANDEIGQLGSMFNYLTLRLKETLGEISQEKSKVEAILAYMTDGLLALDREGRIILLNPAAAAMISVRPEDVIGRRATDALPMLKPEEFNRREFPALETGSPASREVRLEGPPVRLLQADLAPFRTGAGGPAGMVIVLHDVTEEQKLDRLRREFVANVSHELRTPLTTIKSYVETLLDGALADVQLSRQFLGVVDTEADRMTRLLADLLQLSQFDSRVVTLDLAPLDLAPTIRKVLGRLEVQSNRKGLRLAADLAPNVPPVLADRDRIEQVLLNLLTNAMEFTPAGGVVTVSLEARGSYAVVWVRDTGIGIPPDDLPRIFDRFYRVDKARSRELGGTGLGLSIAREIVGAHGGAINLESTFGEGTAVSFTLPLAPEPMEAEG